MGVAKMSKGFSFPWYVTQFLRDYHCTFIVVYSCFEISHTVMGDTKIAIRLSFLWSVSQIFRNFKVTFMVA